MLICPSFKKRSSAVRVPIELANLLVPRDTHRVVGRQGNQPAAARDGIDQAPQKDAGKQNQHL